jgi:hypothetical protein
MWSLTSDHTHYFLKLCITKLAKAGLVIYNRSCAPLCLCRPRETRIPNMEYAVTIAHMVTHTSVTHCTMVVLRSIVAYSISCYRYLHSRNVLCGMVESSNHRYR